jgi:16S rRNA (adenine1518-N6/adenine1519-N6)-dimethyltransferase
MTSFRPTSPEPHRAKKSLGQNFLIDPSLQRKIANAIDPQPDDEVLEIGPGRGALTQHLAGRVRRLVLVELDDELAARLTAQYAADSSVELIHRDVLEVSLEEITTEIEKLKVIGNIPYNITTPIIFALLERRPRPAEIVLMVQREVADRLMAEPGSKTYGALAVGVQSVASVRRVVQVGRGSFRPAPDVDSTVIAITPNQPPQLDPKLEVALRNLTRWAFGQRRKQFQRILRDALSLSIQQVEQIEQATGFALSARPETFSPPEFVRLAAALADAGFTGPRAR